MSQKNNKIKPKVHIIMKQVSNILGIRGDILIGDIRDELARDMLRAVESVVNKEMKRRKYWILVAAKNVGKSIKTSIQIHNRFPPKMIGTMCFYINNRKGLVDMLWCLPLDVPRPDGIITDETAGKVHESAKGMPILH